MSTSTPTAVGIVSDCPLQRHLAQTAMRQLGYEVRYCREPERFDPAEPLPDEPQVWILMIKDEARWDGVTDLFLETAKAPLLFADEEAPQRQSPEYAYWERRLQLKLAELVGRRRGDTPPRLADTSATDLDGGGAKRTPTEPGRTLTLPEYLQAARPGDPLQHVVLLAASLGGPAAVKAFMDLLPPGLPTAFVYAQHIDREGAQVLVRVLGRHGHYRFREAVQGAPLQVGEVIVAPIEQQLGIAADGTLELLGKPWPGPYNPSIDQMMLNIGDHFAQRTLAIVFSGMGEDGARAAPILKAYGARIWCQDSASCANSSMPDAVAATGCAEFRGSPEAMAERLLKSMESEALLARRQAQKGPSDG